MTISSMSKTDAVEMIRSTGATLAATLAALDIDIEAQVSERAETSARFIAGLSDDEFRAFLQYVERIYQTIDTDAK